MEVSFSNSSTALMGKMLSKKKKKSVATDSRHLNTGIREEKEEEVMQIEEEKPEWPEIRRRFQNLSFGLIKAAAATPSYTCPAGRLHVASFQNLVITCLYPVLMRDAYTPPITLTWNFSMPHLPFRIPKSVNFNQKTEELCKYLPVFKAWCIPETFLWVPKWSGPTDPRCICLVFSLFNAPHEKAHTTLCKPLLDELSVVPASLLRRFPPSSSAPLSLVLSH